MSVNKVTVGSTISIQAVKPIEAVPPIGELPTRRVQRRDVPVTPVQDDKLFVRESIGSAIAEKRLDLEILEDGLALSECRNESGAEMGLSIDRPVALALIDVFSRFADEATIKKSIDQNLRLAEFESELLKADYDFLMNSIKSQNPQLVQDLQDSLNSEETTLEEKLRILFEISSKSEEVSRRLDFIRPENEFSSKIQEEANSIKVRFEESRPNNRSFNNVIKSTSTSTSIIKKIQERINATPFSPYELDLIAKIKAGSTLFQDTSAFNSGVRYSYNDLDGLEKTIVCCKVLSKMMAETFTKVKFPNLKNVNLPVSIGSPTTSDNFIFEFNDVSVSGSIGEQTSDGFIRNNNFDSIISKVSERGALDIESLKLMRKTYRDAKNFLRFKRAVGFDNDKCSPQDILFNVMSLVADSFPTYSRGSIIDSVPNENELLDALVMSFGCKNTKSEVNLNALWRAIILSSVSDADYVWGEVDPEVYETRTETKSTSEIDGETKTTKSNSGSNQKGKGGVSAPATDDAYYDPLKKRGFIPKFSEAWISAFLSFQRLTPNLESEPYRHKLFDVDFLRANGVLDSLELDSNDKIPRNANSFSFPENSKQDSKVLYDSVKSYNSRSNTIGSKTIALYNSLVKKFSLEYQVEIDESAFVIDNKTITKNAVLDLVFECLSNITTWLTRPVLSKNMPVYTPRPPLNESERMVLEKAASEGNTYAIERLEQSQTPTVEFFAFLLSMRESNLLSSGSELFKQFEAFRLLKLVRQLSVSQETFFGTFFISLDTGKELLVRPEILILDTSIADDATSDYLRGRIDLTKISELLRDYQEDIADVAILDSILLMIESTIPELVLLQNKSKELRDLMTDFRVSQKTDVLRCLSVQSMTSALLKNRARRIGNTDIFENAYEKDRSNLDISATRWFFSNRRFSDYEKSRLVFFGLPQGFTNALTRQAREIDPETFEIVDDPVPNAAPLYFESWLTSRDVRNSTSIYENRLMTFHPLIHVSQKDKISSVDSLAKKSSIVPTIADIFDRFNIYVYDASIGGWGLPHAVDSSNFRDSIRKLGLTVKKAKEIVASHILDSIHKSVARTLSGLEIDANLLGTYKKALSISDAESVLQLIAGDTAGIVPRGSMSAINFLNRNEDGFIEFVPFSRLRGRSSNKTNPSDHALLMKFFDTRAFTKGTLSKEVLIPSAFERVYCGIFNPNDATINDTPAESINISQITIKAVRS